MLSKAILKIRAHILVYLFVIVFGIALYCYLISIKTLSTSYMSFDALNT